MAYRKLFKNLKFYLKKILKETTVIKRHSKLNVGFSHVHFKLYLCVFVKETAKKTSGFS